MKQLLVVVAMLCASACDRPVTQSEAESIAEDHADARATPLESRIGDLEAKLERVKSIQDPNSDYLKAVHAALDEERANRKREIEELTDHYNEHLYRAHGTPRPTVSPK